MHMPNQHQDALDFCLAVQEKYKLETTVFIGDLADLHSMSYHEKDSTLPNADDELNLIRAALKPWIKAFPKSKVCIGNHDSLIDRKAFTFGIPAQAIVKINRLLETNSWDWKEEHIVPCGKHHVVFRHSWGPSIELAMMRNGTSVVAGHWHSKSSIVYAQTSFRRLFGMQLGCLIAPNHRAFHYNKRDIRRPLLNVGKIVDGEPALLSMNLDSNGRWTKEVP